MKLLIVGSKGENLIVFTTTIYPGVKVLQTARAACTKRGLSFIWCKTAAGRIFRAPSPLKEM